MTLFIKAALVAPGLLLVCGCLVGGQQSEGQRDGGSSATPAAEDCPKPRCDGEYELCVKWSTDSASDCGKGCSGSEDILGCLRNCSSTADFGRAVCADELDECRRSEADDCWDVEPNPAGQCMGETRHACYQVSDSACSTVKGCRLESFLDGDLVMCSGQPVPCSEIEDGQSCRKHGCTWE